ncbi:MAG: hypothetical protein CMH62_00355 [Nanoarchaeota archaeon]|nr:hypothetical protein [Nanoarchaeota archaeon]
MVLSLLLSAGIAIAKYFSGNFSIESSKYKAYLISFVAGISVTYIFLHLLPNLQNGDSDLIKSLFIFVLIGFVVFHLTEKFIYRYVGKGKVSEDLKLNHSLGLFLYEFSIGIVLVQFTRVNVIEGFLFFVPVFLHTALSNLSLHKIHGLNPEKEQILENKTIRMILSGGAVYGALIAFFYNLNLRFSYILTGLVAGILLYVVIREMIPKEKEGNPIGFVLGVVFYSLLIFATWIF